jgi:hypothetical protein
MTSQCANSCCRCCATCSASPTSRRWRPEHAGHVRQATGTAYPSAGPMRPARGRLPLVFAGSQPGPGRRGRPLRRAQPRNRARPPAQSPFMLAQEALNATDTSLWAMVSNGLTLRILRDNASLTRPAYIEVDLETLFSRRTVRRLQRLLAAWLTPAALPARPARRCATQ